jgi:hypothetical protein
MLVNRPSGLVRNTENTSTPPLLYPAQPSLRTMLPPLEYPLTRRFQSRWISAAAYGGGFVSIVILCFLNGMTIYLPSSILTDATSPVALVGYDTVSEFQTDFNVTQAFWFDALVPSYIKKQKAGSLCNSRLFNVGESMVTNSSLFEWKVDSVNKANAGGSGFSYTGETLDNCDVTQIDFFGDLRTWTIEGTVHMFCAPPTQENAPKTPQGWELAGAAKFGISGLPAKQSNFRRMAKSADPTSTAFIISEL